MDPVLAIVWIGVAVFAATSALALLYLAGFAPKLREEYGRHLFRILVAEIVIASVAVFAYFIQTRVRADSALQVPIKDLMVIEESDTPLIVHDGSLAIYLKSTDVSRVRRIMELQLDTRADFSTSIQVNLEPESPLTATIASRKYRLSYSRMGTLDANPKEKQGKNRDFVLLSIETTK